MQEVLTMNIQDFTDFCIKLTRGSREGCARCEKCDREGTGVYHCHAGLIDFGIPLMINDEKVGSVIGGQVLPEQPDEEKFRQVAQEVGKLSEQSTIVNRDIEQIVQSISEAVEEMRK